jgi:hypothetical protein
LVSQLLGEELGHLAELGPGLGHLQRRVEPLLVGVHQVLVGEERRPVVEDVDVAVAHQPVGLPARLRVELAVGRHHPGQVLVGAGVLLEVAVERLDLTRRDDVAEVDRRVGHQVVGQFAAADQVRHQRLDSV